MITTRGGPQLDATWKLYTKYLIFRDISFDIRKHTHIHTYTHTICGQKIIGFFNFAECINAIVKIVFFLLCWYTYLWCILTLAAIWDAYFIVDCQNYYTCFGARRFFSFVVYSDYNVLSLCYQPDNFNVRLQCYQHIIK